MALHHTLTDGRCRIRSTISECMSHLLPTVGAGDDIRSRDRSESSGTSTPVRWNIA